MSLQKVAIIGAGAFARNTLDVLDAVNQLEPTYDVLGFVVDPQYGTPGTCVNEKPILGGFNWLSDHAEEVRAICAQGAPEVRRKLVRRAEALGVRFCTVVHPTAVLTRWVTIGEGTIITAGCIFCNQIKVGRHVLVNLDCTIAEDTILEDFATVGPGVHLGRGCYLNEGCNVGTGANIIEQVRIGAWSIVGAGGTIVKDVPTNSTVVGVPGTVIKTRSEGWYLD